MLEICIPIIVISVVFGICRYSMQGRAKKTNDLHKYKDINQVIEKFGAPDNIDEYGKYKKYTFRRGANGWTWHKSVVDVFTTENGKIVKHEHFQE